jgi:hypothetical protein
MLAQKDLMLHVWLKQYKITNRLGDIFGKYGITQHSQNWHPATPQGGDEARNDQTANWEIEYL